MNTAELAKLNPTFSVILNGTRFAVLATLETDRRCWAWTDTSPTRFAAECKMFLFATGTVSRRITDLGSWAEVRRLPHGGLGLVQDGVCDYTDHTD
jgi:hypothetical protein